MAKKLIIIGIIILAGLIAGLTLLKNEGGISLSSGTPEAVLKDFFKAVNKGDFEKAGKLLSDDSIESFFGANLPCSMYGFHDSPEYEACIKKYLNSLVGTIEDVKITSKREIADDLVELKYKISFKPGLQEEAERLIEQNKDYPWVKDKETQNSMKKESYRGLFLRSVVNDFEKEREEELVKWKEGWKI